MSISGRIFTNTLATYLKILVFALTGLFAVPVALRTLGAVDYGVYSVIGGCLSVLMFLNYSLQTGAERHIAYALGQQRREEASRWFITSLLVHAVVAAGLAATALLAADWVLHRLLVLPASRLAAAAWIYRMFVVTMVCDVVLTPYQALLIAHEAIAQISLINTGGGILLLAAIFCLPLLPGDSLLWYSAIYCLFQILTAVGPAAYCYYSYPESRFGSLAAEWSGKRLRELFSFSGWALLQMVAVLFRTQGPAVVLNLFFGPIANAAYGLAVQVQMFASNLVWGFLGSATPAIVKRHAAGDQRGMTRLTNQTNTYGFAILWVALAPILFETGLCLKIWLHTPPAHTAAFLQPVLLAVLIEQLTLGYNLSVVATGRVAGFSAAISVAMVIGVPGGYLLLRAGKPGSWMLWATAGGAVVGSGVRLWFARQQLAMSLRTWLREVALPAVAVVLGSSAAVLGLRQVLGEGWLRLCLVGAGNAVIACAAVWFLAMNSEQRASLRRYAAAWMFRRSPTEVPLPEVPEETFTG